MIWLALTTGILGSLHCAGMCGPIVLNLPGSQKLDFDLVLSRLFYHSGRIISYSALGLVAGVPGIWLKSPEWQQRLSIFSGGILLLAVVVTLLGRKGKIPAAWSNMITGSMSGLLKKSSWWRWGALGALNGLLPCGLVYVALAGALASGSSWEGALYMSAFGVGTLPLMMVLSLGPGFIPLKYKLRLRNIIPYTTFIVGVLLVVRGLNLGIPYLSPERVVEKDKCTMDCCGDTNENGGTPENTP